jgi:signal peptidase II
MRRSTRVTTILAILVFSTVCDQVLKLVARSTLQYSPAISFLDDFVRLVYAENRGIMLSVGAALPPEVRFWVFGVLVGLLLSSLLAYVLWNRGMDSVHTIAWTLIVSGGLGNLLDRLTKNGVVIDFVSVGFGVVRTAVFNLADVLVFAGVLLLLARRQKNIAGVQGQQEAEPERVAHEKTTVLPKSVPPDPTETQHS